MTSNKNQELREWIADEERIVRAICSPYHTQGDVLLPGAYDPYPVDSDEVSVMRVDWLGADRCKAHGKSLENPANPRKKFAGLAVLLASQIRSTGATVEDSRQVFLGHADIHLGHPTMQRDQDPIEPANLKLSRDRRKALAKMARYCKDPNSDAQGWTGESLEPNP